MGAITSLPAGIITFLLTDIEGSTRLWEQHPEPMRLAVARHDALLTAIIEEHAGSVIRSRCEGDSFCAVFPRASDAAAAAVALQCALQAEPWPAPVALRVRAALHTGEATPRGSNYEGLVVNRCARLRAVAHGGQVLLSRSTADLVQDGLPAPWPSGSSAPTGSWTCSGPRSSFSFSTLSCRRSFHP
jgi:class 3 adenylate cyclase